jgi:hypothetical protein
LPTRLTDRLDHFLHVTSACSILVLDEIIKTVATVTVREKHDRKCGGDPGTAPRRFTMEFDLKTGAAQWDNNDEMEMRPVPR